MKFLLLLCAILLLAGCATTAPKTTAFDYLFNDSDVNFQQRIAEGAHINKQDETGQSPLHFAIRYAPKTVNDLLAAGANVDAQDHSGMTPLHMAVLYRKSKIVPLLLKGADVTLSTTEFVYCNNKFGRRKFVRMKVTPQKLAWYCGKYKAEDKFESFVKDTTSWNQAKQDNSKVAYKKYFLQFPKGIFSTQASLVIADFEKQELVKIKSQEKCAMESENWVFVEGSCKNKLGHGKGVAVTLEGNRFEGEFTLGMFSRGQYFENENMVYEGPYENGLPHGLGICFFEGSFEECKQYRGQRIDSLFKQRQYMRKELALSRKANNSGADSSSSSGKLGYLSDLNSEDDIDRTVSRVRAAVDLYKILSK
ncbi:MAG: ankyrin repeat domain-containing protein [Bermanella sp.]